MNKPRRKELGIIRDKLEEINSDLTMLRDEEQEYIDNMPENMQSGEKYDMAENAVSDMDDAINSIEEAVSSIEESSS